VRAPKEHSGCVATVPETFALLAELAESDANLAQALRVHFGYVEGPRFARQGARRERWLKRFGNGDIVGGAWTEIGDAKMASFSTRVSEKNGVLSISGAKYYDRLNFDDWISRGSKSRE
jgi:alkylation response protein AidB-like acyl-CoA dehydrogenase